MAEKKRWILGWWWFDEEAKNAVGGGGGRDQMIWVENVTLKTMYDKINEWNKNVVNGGGDGCFYYLVGEAK